MMPCHAAMTTDYVSVSPDQEVEEALTLMKEKGVEYMPVVDDDHNLTGLFSYQILFKNLLPVTVAIGGEVQLDTTLRAAPGIAKRLKKVLPLKVREVMETRVNVVHPETPVWEGVNLLVQYGAPLLVVDGESGKLAGLITGGSALEELQRLKDSES